MNTSTGMPAEMRSYLTLMRMGMPHSVVMRIVSHIKPEGIEQTVYRVGMESGTLKDVADALDWTRWPVYLQEDETPAPQASLTNELFGLVIDYHVFASGLESAPQAATAKQAQIE